MLPFVKLHGSVFAAERLGSVWSMRRNAKRCPQPDLATTEHLLNELTEVYDLGGAQYEISAMLCSLALDRPHSVLEFLIVRGRREEAMWRREV
jgi:hypothetical protein